MHYAKSTQKEGGVEVRRKNYTRKKINCITELHYNIILLNTS